MASVSPLTIERITSSSLRFISICLRHDLGDGLREQLLEAFAIAVVEELVELHPQRLDDPQIFRAQALLVVANELPRSCEHLVMQDDQLDRVLEAFAIGVVRSIDVRAKGAFEVQGCLQLFEIEHLKLHKNSHDVKRLSFLGCRSKLQEHESQNQLNPMNPLEFHKKLQGKIEVISRAPVQTKEDLRLAYTPGVAEPCLEIHKDISKVYDYTRKGHMVAVITDGSAVLGLGDIGPEAGLPVMEGKCVLFKEFAGVDAFPIAIKTQDVDEFVRTVELITPMFGGINLEDISAPRCFEIEEKLKAKLDIPVFHDDQHGTAIVVLAGLMNAVKVTGKELNNLRIVVNGVGAAGVAIMKLLRAYAPTAQMIGVDSQGIITNERTDLNDVKQRLLKEGILTSVEAGGLKEAVKDADVFIGVSKPGVLTKEMVQSMNSDAIIFALSNPTPEIMPDIAKEAGARVIATGRSDFANQVNNVLAFPGIFKGLLEARITVIDDALKLRVANAIASMVPNPTEHEILPEALNKSVADVVAKAVKG